MVKREGTLARAVWEARCRIGQALRSAVINALVDALGGKHIDTPVTPYRVWQILNPPPPMLGLY